MADTVISKIIDPAVFQDLGNLQAQLEAINTLAASALDKFSQIEEIQQAIAIKIGEQSAGR